MQHAEQLLGSHERVQSERPESRHEQHEHEVSNCVSWSQADDPDADSHFGACEQDRKPHHVVRVLSKQAADENGGEESGHSCRNPKDYRKNVFKLVVGNDPNKWKAHACQQRRRLPAILTKSTPEPDDMAECERTQSAANHHRKFRDCRNDESNRSRHQEHGPTREPDLNRLIGAPRLVRNGHPRKNCPDGDSAND